jgi:hypothetical protein
VLNRKKVTLVTDDGTPAFDYPVPTDELIFIPPRQNFFEERGTLGGEQARSIGDMLTGNGAPNMDKNDGKFAAVGQKALVAYRPGTARSVRVGQVIKNDTANQAMVIHRYNGEWAKTRVRWTPSMISEAGQPSMPEIDSVLYKSVARQVKLMADGAITYSDLRALENGRYDLIATQNSDLTFLTRPSVDPVPDEHDHPPATLDVPQTTLDVPPRWRTSEALAARWRSMHEGRRAQDRVYTLEEQDGELVATGDYEGDQSLQKLNRPEVSVTNRTRWLALFGLMQDQGDVADDVPTEYLEGTRVVKMAQGILGKAFRVDAAVGIVRALQMPATLPHT